MITLEPPRGFRGDTDPWALAGLSRGGLTRFVRRAQEAVGLRGEVDVLLAGDGRLRALNREFRGKNKPTDVLSFPAAQELRGEHAGDLAVSLETAARQARQQGHSLRDEVRVLLLHGLLHLSGMDHETDRGEMAAREAELRKELRLPLGLIARVEGEAESDDRNGAKLRGRSRGVDLKQSRFPAGTTAIKASATAKARATATSISSAKPTVTPKSDARAKAVRRTVSA